MFFHRCLRGVIVAISIVTASADVFAVSSYALTLLKPWSGNDFSVATGINDAGKVVGSSYSLGYDRFPYERATLWNDAVPFGLPGLGWSFSRANAINNSGQIAGWSDRGWSTPRDAVVWKDLVPIDLGSNGMAYGINDAGWVVGKTSIEESIVATVWIGTSRTLLKRGGIVGSANGVNSSGQIAGTSGSWGLDYADAMLWKDLNDDEPLNLGKLPGHYGRGVGYDINDVGHVVGFSSGADVGIHATYWDGTNAVRVGTLNDYWSIAYAINNAGQIVGTSSNGVDAEHATLWEDGIAIDLNDHIATGVLPTGWYLKEATAISERGWIAGNAYDPYTDTTRGFRLAITTIPEPQTQSLLVIGLIALGLVARCRRLNPGCSSDFTHRMARFQLRRPTAPRTNSTNPRTAGPASAAHSRLVSQLGAAPFGLAGSSR